MSPTSQQHAVACPPRVYAARTRAQIGRGREIGALARRAGLVIVTWVALIALGAAPASAQCGQTTDVSPRVSAGPGPPPLAVGDSVLYDASQSLASYGFHSNAMVCRTMAQGIVWLQGHAHGLPNLVVVALGTNGAVTVGQIDQLLAIVGPTRVLAMVTPHNGNYAYVPGLIRTAAQQHRGRILVLDWDQLSAGHANWFAPDGIHLGSAAGVTAFARLVANALLATPSGPSSPTSVAPGPVGTPTTIKPLKPAQPTVNSRAAKFMRLALSTMAALRAWLVGL
ncbi:MAG: hypothetical protein M3065_04640 [Actinomycetota bacterium]|nr:hypothetical protein [Actinomycetota bacterium]